jgi:hypothetical protein
VIIRFDDPRMKEVIPVGASALAPCGAEVVRAKSRVVPDFTLFIDSLKKLGRLLVLVICSILSVHREGSVTEEGTGVLPLLHAPR